MEYFLDVSRTVPDGLGFRQFDASHLLWLALFAVITVVSGLWYHRQDEKKRVRWRKTVAVLLVLDELFKTVCLIIGGNYAARYLPLELCSINLFLIVIHAWKPGAVLGNYLYAVCLPGTVAALLFPSWTKLPAMNFMYLHSFTIHILLAVYPIVLVANGDIKPSVKAIPKCLVLLLAMAGFVNIVNEFLGTNFFFLEKAPNGNPLKIFETLFGNHLYGFPVIIAAVLTVMYLPFALGHGRRPHHHRPRIAH